MQPESTRRLFFALWPDPDLARLLERRLPAQLPPVDGRKLGPGQWHVTLEFLGSVRESRLGELFDLASGVAGSAFAIEFDRLEYWRRPQVLCLGSSQIPKALLDLVNALRAALTGRDFRTDRRDFRPHVTVARKVRHPPAAGPFEVLRWPARAFSLVESVTDLAGAIYRPLMSWPLRETRKPG